MEKNTNVKNNRLRKKRFLLSAAAFLLAVLSVSLFLSVKYFPAKAETEVSPAPFLPSSPIEYNSLVSPKDAVYLKDGRIATIQGSEVVIYLTDGTKRTVEGLTSLKQIKIFEDDSLIVSANGTLRKINLTDYSYENLTDGSDVIGGNYFDLNGEHLITAYGDDLKIYTLGTTITRIDEFSGVKGDYPIALSDDGTIFYHSNSTPQKFIVSNLNSLEITRTITIDNHDIQVSDVITDDNRFYFIENGKIYRGENGEYKPALLTVDSSDNFELGNIVSPVSLSFKGDNLLITDDSLSAVQEFKVSGNELVFTGFAVASGKTAYNRIDKTAKSISNFGKSVAVIDDNKLTVIKNVSGNFKDKGNFYNYFYGDGFVPDKLVIGDKCALITSTTQRKIRIIDFNKGDYSDVYSFTNNYLTGVAYANGYFYVAETLTGSTKNTAVYRVAESVSDITPELIITASENFGEGTLISVDVYGNVVLYKNGDFYKYAKSGDGYAEPEKINGEPVENVKDISTDFGGNVFAFTGSGVSYLIDGQAKNVALSSEYASFALSFDSKTVFFIKENDERAYKTDLLFNLAANDIPVPNEFKTTAESANINAFKTYRLKDGATSFIISKQKDEEKFAYEKTGAGIINEYVLICETEYKTADDLTTDLSILLGYNELKKPVFIAVNSEYIDETTSVADKSGVRYTTTDVNAYYIPMITEDDEFCLTDGDAVLRLKAKTEITVKSEITFSNAEFNGKFLYVSLKNSAGETVYGYIPENFTVKVLSENVSGDTSVSRIKPENAHSFRNSLIVIALAASVFGTSLFFILKKKS